MTKLRIKGMTCGHCVSAVTRVLESVEGTTKVIEVNLDRAEAIVEGTPTPEALIASLEEEGYGAELAE